MKNFLFVVLILIVSASCKKDESVSTSYYIVNNSEVQESSFEHLDGTMWETTIFCFDKEGDVVREDNLGAIPPDGGTSKHMEVTNNIVKIVVSFRFLPKESPFYDLDSNNRKYTLTRFSLVQGDKNKIVVDGNTSVKGTLSFVGTNEILIKDRLHSFVK